jgi:regulator of telomere elongation helicase 1
LPYNYLVESSARKSQSINVENAIVIFDEGHNVESCCSDATSFELTSDDLDKAMVEVKIAIEILPGSQADRERMITIESLEFVHSIPLK